MLLSLHKALPSSTLYYKTSQYYFVLQSLHKARSSPTLVHKALPSTARFWNRQALHTEAFTHNKLLHREAFTHSKLSHTASVYTQNTYTQCFYTWQAFTHTASFLNKAFAHREAFTHSKLLHREAFTHSKLSHTASVYKQNTYTQCFAHGKRLHTQKLLHRDAFTHREAFTHSELLHTKSFSQSKLLQKKVFTQRNFLVHNHNRNCSSKTGSRRQSGKKKILKHFLKGLLNWKLLAPKLRKSADKSLSQPWCSHSNTIYEIQLHKTIVLRMQPQHQATLAQPLQCDLQRLSCKTQ